MTVSLSKDSPTAIKVRYTYGPATMEFVEDIGHLKSVRDQLVTLLDEMEQ